MRRVLLLLLIAYAAHCSLALTDGEIKALQDIATEWDYFAYTPSPWPTDGFENACKPPVFYGLSCTNDPDPHVTSLYVFVKNSTLPFIVTLYCPLSTF